MSDLIILLLFVGIANALSLLTAYRLINWINQRKSRINVALPSQNKYEHNPMGSMVETSHAKLFSTPIERLIGTKTVRSTIVLQSSREDFATRRNFEERVQQFSKDFGLSYESLELDRFADGTEYNENV